MGLMAIKKAPNILYKKYEVNKKMHVIRETIFLLMQKK